jgi:hypothetical protein
MGGVSMNKGVYMTQKEINRTEIFLRVKHKQLKQVQAAKKLKLSVRHTQRLYEQFKNHGMLRGNAGRAMPLKIQIKFLCKPGLILNTKAQSGVLN